MAGPPFRLAGHDARPALPRHHGAVIAFILVRVLLLGLVTSPMATAAPPQVVISEVLSSNIRGIQDEDGDTSDWIELWNHGASAADLGGMGLADKRGNARPWRLPQTNLPPSGRLVVWASGKDRAVPGRPLHAPFKLSGEDPRLALLAADGTVLSELASAVWTRQPDVSSGLLPGTTGRWAYMTNPTPGAPNSGDKAQPHDALAEPRHEPAALVPDGALTVSVLARPEGPDARPPLVAWRRNFGVETAALLHDDGRDGDERAGDGRWSARIPIPGARNGDMVRWRFELPTRAGEPFRWPLRGATPRTPPCHGTVVQPAASDSALHVVHLFVEPAQLGPMDSDAGATGCLFHAGEFHDDVRIKVRGNTTAGFPKKSHRVEFPSGKGFRPPHGGPRVRATSFMAEWGDPTYLRQHLAFWLMARAGVAAPFHEPVRLHLNGEFYQLAMHSLPLGEDLLRRAGLDPGGALYKAVGYVVPGGDGSGGFEKKTRRKEGHDDYVAMARAIGDDPDPARRANALMDLFDVPAAVNYLAVARLCQEDDDIWANMSLYHDNDGSGRWRPVAFDMNVSWGFSYGTGEILADRDDFRSHPFWGAAGIGSNQGHNRLYDVVVRNPFTRSMLVRRMRTLLDDAWRPPGAPGDRAGLIEGHVRAMSARMQPEATLDRARWGEPWTGHPGIEPARSLAAGVDDLLRRFVEPRRRHFLLTHSETNAARPMGIGTDRSAGIPASQPPPAVLRIDARVVEPGEGGHGVGWLVVSNTHPFAVDLSGWRLGGAKPFTLPPGAVIPANASGIVVESWPGGSRRMESPRPKEGRLVLGRWKQLPPQAGPVPLNPP